MSFVSTFNHTNSMTDITFTRSEIESIMNGLLDTQNVLNRVDSVSYTHLTLPTNREV